MHKLISVLSLLLLYVVYIVNEHIYFNPTGSEIRGYYFVYKPHIFRTNDLVLVCVRDKKSINVLQQFGLPYIATGACQLPFLLKKIAGVDGDKVVVSNRGIIINSNLQKNSMPIKRYKNIYLNPLLVGTEYTLSKDDYFLLGQGDNSYDSRYFGIVRTTDLQYRAILFWSRSRPIW